jgi:hypothetical protein
MKQIGNKIKSSEKSLPVQNFRFKKGIAELSNFKLRF